MDYLNTVGKDFHYSLTHSFIQQIFTEHFCVSGSILGISGEAAR